jgi:hypothetical protein
MRASILVAAIIYGSMVTGCGGGSSGASPATAPAVVTAEGVYAGTVTGGQVHNTLVLENDQIYVVYGTSVGGKIVAQGFLQGNGRSSGGTYTATDVREYRPNTAASSNFSLSATYAKDASFNGITSNGGVTTSTFTGGPIQNSLYNYSAAASLANITGAWLLTGLDGAPVSLTISANGSFTGSSFGCAFSGALTPRASGKNVFNATATFGAAPCLIPGQSVTGIALEYPLVGGTRQLIIAGIDASRNNGTALIGAR